MKTKIKNLLNKMKDIDIYKIYGFNKESSLDEAVKSYNNFKKNLAYKEIRNDSFLTEEERLLREVRIEFWSQNHSNHSSLDIIDKIMKRYKVPKKKAKAIEYLARPNWAKTRGID